ncbi:MULTISPECIES: type II toxin-antitoxin system HicB family antitoxin [Enterobacter]|jgi:predicted RNase H-like HicB family nuclease|uniref:Type II toxin-antitoxin system HicB family antitoxin n=1 Tax=Enterobacter bugandensis TaxID=881260 RepID=A0ABX4VM61_9ENTR|nr:MULTISPECIES: type II toxin-antitoxin system HicB family antitoxin [Enterobacter]MBZ6368697.1 type II toxin-antitoxin system HicB family antitoxin [Enterobacter bugandensis]NUX27212.1 type II toxin-antitoxin system HicB family antitoxin [Enterobacter bugandensis]NUX50228.1 type II toxin-antitoxin system HicB family antitoxin [Enterobacter bugandensis]NUX71182.1 type II toxin-antitoxin system HicB family antitoxin [Enterobacter bugandensis]NUX96495.1 type II toxin-antitoxin system HicB famil
MFYPAYIHSDTDGSASGFFPDVPGCFFAGDSLDDAFQDAREALTAHFEALFEMDEALPLPGNVEAHLESRPEDFIGGQWLLVDINMKQFDGRTERINITMPRRLLVKIDSFVSEHPQFGNRSAFLAEAARRVLSG